MEPLPRAMKGKEKRRPLKNCPRRKRRRLLRAPNIKRDVEEVKRLMNRVPKVEPKKGFYECAVCLAQDHNSANCVCLDEIPKGVTLSPLFDTVCIGCGKIGDPPCCGKGTYARLKYCSGCNDNGHWYWETRCPKGYIFSPWITKLPGVEYEELTCPVEVNGTLYEAPGYWKVKEVKSGSSNQSSKMWKSLGSKLVRGVKNIAL